MQSSENEFREREPYKAHNITLYKERKADLKKCFVIVDIDTRARIQSTGYHDMIAVCIELERMQGQWKRADGSVMELGIVIDNFWADESRFRTPSKAPEK